MSDWSERAKTDWYVQWDATDPPATHVITIIPTVQVAIAIPPWVTDPESEIAEIVAGWIDRLSDPAELWTEPLGDCLLVGDIGVGVGGEHRWVEAVKRTDTSTCPFSHDTCESDDCSCECHQAVQP